MYDHDDESYYAILWINDGYDFVDSEDLRPRQRESGAGPIYLPGKPSAKLRACCGITPQTCWLSSQDSWQLTRPWAAIEEPPYSLLRLRFNPCALHLLADFDGDGMVDLLGSPESIDIFLENYYYGLALWRLDVSGGWTHDSLLDWKVLPLEAIASDVNGDGRAGCGHGRWQLDRRLRRWWCYSASATAHLPVLEGYYPLPGESSQVLTGDVNGDGDTDLVVLGTSLASDHGGVSVFINQGTPVYRRDQRDGRPRQRPLPLGANYPNPFNPCHDHSPRPCLQRSQGRGLNHLQCPRDNRCVRYGRGRCPLVSTS